MQADIRRVLRGGNLSQIHIFYNVAPYLLLLKFFFQSCQCLYICFYIYSLILFNLCHFAILPVMPYFKKSAPHFLKYRFELT